MTFPQIRRLVDSLMLKYADEVEARRLRPVAQRFCEDLAPRRNRQEAGTPALHRRMDPNLPPAGAGTQPPTPGPRLSQRLPGPLPRPSRPAPGQRAPARPAPQGRPPRHHPPRPRSPHPLLIPPLPSFLRRQESRERTTEESGRLATVSSLDSCEGRNDEAELRNSYLCRLSRYVLRVWRRGEFGVIGRPRCAAAGYDGMTRQLIHASVNQRNQMNHVNHSFRRISGIGTNCPLTGLVWMPIIRCQARREASV